MVGTREAWSRIRLYGSVDWRAARRARVSPQGVRDAGLALVRVDAATPGKAPDMVRAPYCRTHGERLAAMPLAFIDQ